MDQLTYKYFEPWVRGTARTYFPIGEDRVSNKAILCSLYFKSIEKVEADLGLVIEKALEDLKLEHNQISAIYPYYHYPRDEHMENLASLYFEERYQLRHNNRFHFEYRQVKNGFYQQNVLLFSANIVSEQPSPILEKIKSAGGNPVAICTLIERRKNKSLIAGVPVFSLADLSEYTFERASLQHNVIVEE